MDGKEAAAYDVSMRNYNNVWSQMSLNNMTSMLNQGQMTSNSKLNCAFDNNRNVRKSLKLKRKQQPTTTRSYLLLDKVCDMREVVSDMTHKLDNNLIRQERILSKLLDAQRSINERDFEKQRESTAGQKFVRQSPAELNLSSSKGKDKIKDELNKAVN